MAELNLAHLTQEQLDQLMKSISTIQNLTNTTIIPSQQQQQLPEPQLQSLSCQQKNESSESPSSVSHLSPSTNNSQVLESSKEQLSSTPLIVSKNSTPSFLAKRNITLPVMSRLSDFKIESDSNTNILSKLNESLNLLQETYNEIGYSEGELLKSETYLMGRLSDLIQQADFTKQSLNLEIMTIMNNISEIDCILTKRFKYDYVIEDSIKETILKFNTRFQHSISNNELSVILLELNPDSSNLLELKQKMLKVFNQLHPRFTNKVIDLSNKTLRFYELYNKIDNYNLRNSKLLKQLPTIEECNTYNNESIFDFEQVDHIINNTVYKEISHTLFTDIDDETSHLKTELINRIQVLFEIAQQVAVLYTDLFIEEQNSKILYLNELQKDGSLSEDQIIEFLHHNIGLKSKNVEELVQLKESLSKDKQTRETRLSKLNSTCQQLWFRLNEDPKNVELFTQQYNNLKTESLRQFELELERLNDLKLKNIASFIAECRAKIQESWDFLMYSDYERKSLFAQFFNNNESDYTEKLLDLHGEYYDKLCAQIEDLKPILHSIKELEDLLLEKQHLEENCKDSSRLLQRNSFRILKEEEKTRSRLSRQIPQSIQDLKIKLQDFEVTNGKPLMIDGKVYYEVLLDIEENLNTKPSTKRKQQQQQQKQHQQQQKQRSLSVSNKSAPSTVIRRPNSAPSPSFAQSKSATRRPFSLLDETPVRRGIPTATNSSLRLNKASVTTLNDLNIKRKPLTPTSQIISPLYQSPERKRTLSPSRAIITKLDDQEEPPLKKISGLRSPIRTIGIPLKQQSQQTNSKINILPNLKYGTLQYNGMMKAGAPSPIQLSSSDISDADDDDNDNDDRKINKENDRARFGYIV